MHQRVDLTGPGKIPTLHIAASFLRWCYFFSCVRCVYVFHFVILFLVIGFVGYSLSVPMWFYFVVDTGTTGISSSSSTTLDLEMTVSLLQQHPPNGCCRFKASWLASNTALRCHFLVFWPRSRGLVIFFGTFPNYCFYFLHCIFYLGLLMGSQPIFWFFDSL